MYLRGRLVARDRAAACVTLDVRRLFRPADLWRRVRSERREMTNAIRSNPSATPGPTTAGSHSAGNRGNDNPGAAGSDGPGVPVPKSGAHGTLGAPPPAPCAPLDAETAAHCAASQLSTTFRAPKSRSMSRAHGTLLLEGLIGKPHAALNSSSMRPWGLNSVAIAYTDHAVSSTVYAP